MSELHESDTEYEEPLSESHASSPNASLPNVPLPNESLPDGAEPGATGPKPDYAVVTDEPIDEAAVRAAVEAEECGAVLVFHGVVRDHDGGESVRALDYSAHPEAAAFLERVIREEQQRTGLRLAAAHRVGALAIGDAALVAGASAPHRAEAFAALEQLIVRIKAEVPIWKRQHFAGGASEWVGL
ncbi:molybdenum cofactor biosynthesis protein MoaE [Leucobacter sp. GX24907]